MIAADDTSGHDTRLPFPSVYLAGDASIKSYAGRVTLLSSSSSSSIEKRLSPGTVHRCFESFYGRHNYHLLPRKSRDTRSLFFPFFPFFSFFLETVTRSIDRFLDTTTSVDRLLVNNLINVEAPPTNGMSFIEDTIPPSCFLTLLNRVTSTTVFSNRTDDDRRSDPVGIPFLFLLLFFFSIRSRIPPACSYVSY